MSRFVGGSQLIALRIAQQLGRRVVLRSPVRRISQKGGRVTVESDRYTVKCKRVIVAIPPTLTGRIDYHPILPPERDQLTQRYGQGTLTKVAAVYDKPFWRDKGLTGQAVSTDGLVSATFDDSPPGRVAGRHLRLRRRRHARAPTAHVAPDDARDSVLGEFAAFFGDEAQQPDGYFDTRWTNEQWTRGCPVGIAGPGTLLAYGDQLRQPVRRASTGPGPRPRPTGTATWTARCARASAPPRRCWTSCETRADDRAARRRRGRRGRRACAGAPALGHPHARGRPAARASPRAPTSRPTAASTRAPTTTRPATPCPRACSSTWPTGRCCAPGRSAGQDLSQAHGVQVATSDAQRPARAARQGAGARDPARPAHGRADAPTRRSPTCRCAARRPAHRRCATRRRWPTTARGARTARCT